MPNTRIYLDYASTTPCDPAVVAAMEPFWSNTFGNPSSIHQEGMRAKQAVQEATERIAMHLHCKPSQLLFTGSATESCNLAIRGTALAARANDPNNTHIVTSAIEHAAVLDTCKDLEQQGFTVTYVQPDAHGRISPQSIETAITDHTCLVSVMHGNNEIGTIQPIRKIGSICKDRGIALHTDACQSAPYLSIEPERLSVDLLTLNGSKLYGPKGIGLLYARKPAELAPIITGGSQQYGVRAGTLPVALIVGLAKAIELQCAKRTQETERLRALREQCIQDLQRIGGNITGSPHAEHHLPHIIHVTFNHAIDGQTLVLYADAKGISCATGSACTTAQQEPSHVLQALHMPRTQAMSALRLSLGQSTTRTSLQQAVRALESALQLLST